MLEDCCGVGCWDDEKLLSSHLRDDGVSLHEIIDLISRLHHVHQVEILFNI